MAGLVAITHDRGGRRGCWAETCVVKGIEFRMQRRVYGIELSVRAVRRRGSKGRLPVLGVELDRFNNQVECMNAVDLAGHAIGFAGDGAKAFGEVKQAIHTAGVVIEHLQQGTGAVFRPREQEQVIGAEVEHGGGK